MRKFKLFLADLKKYVNDFIPLMILIKTTLTNGSCQIKADSTAGNIRLKNRS